jgi:glycosyltransferase involved in cell wall biosynthesis
MAISARMHLAYVNMLIEYYSPVSGGAISTVMMCTARELIARGHKVSVLTPTDNNETYDVGEVFPIETRGRGDLHFFQRRLSGIRNRIWRYDWPYYEYYLRSVRRQLKQLSPQPDAVVVFNDFVSPKYIKRILPRARLVVWLHNECRTRQDIRETDRNTDAYVTCSDYVRRWTLENHGLSPARFSVARNGVDAAVFHPRKDFLEPRKPVRVLFVGRIDPNKGPDLAADAVAALQAEGLPVSLTVAGGLWFYGHGNEMADPFFRELKSKMDAAHADYCGHLPRGDIPELIRQHDVVCLLSRSQDPYPLVTLEAMASGCAVIASDRGGLPEACREAGLLVNPDNFADVVGALRSLVIDSQFLRRAKQKAVEWATGEPWSECAAIVEQAALGHASVESSLQLI